MRGELSRFAAANARARSIRATLLGRASLESLYALPTAPALLDALSHTAYEEGAQGKGMSEADVRRRIGRVGRALLATLEGPERAFVRDVLLRHEVESVRLVIRAVAGQLGWARIAPYVLALPGIASIDARDLASSRDLRDLIDRLAGTAYYAPVQRLGSAAPFALEIAVELDAYERLWRGAGELRPADCAHARHLLGILFDVLNLGWIARYRHALGLAPEEILNYTLREGRWLSAQDRCRLAEVGADSWGAALAHTPYGALVDEAGRRGFDAVSGALWGLLATEIGRELRAEPFHIGVPLGLLLELEIEVRDLRVLIAAKALSLPSGEVFERLASRPR